MTGRTRRVPVCLLAVVLAAWACGGAWAETTIRLEGVPEELSFPLPEGRNVVLTAIVQGDAAQAVWLATDADAPGRVMLTAGGEGQYQINLADPVVAALLRASEGKRQFRVFARTDGGDTVASVAVRYGLSGGRAHPPQLYVRLQEKEQAERVATVDVLSIEEEIAALAGTEGEIPAWALAVALQGAMKQNGFDAWYRPGALIEIEVRFDERSTEPGVEALAGGNTWPFLPEEAGGALVLAVDDRLRQAWQEDGELRVRCTENGKVVATFRLHAIPSRLALDGGPHRVKLIQRTSRKLPGSGGYARLHIDDITGGQTLVSVRTARGDVLLEETSLRAGEEARFTLGDTRYKVSVVRLVNFLFDDDYGLFSVSVVQDEERQSREAELLRIDALIALIAKSDVVFVRAGKEYAGPRAAEHIREKFEHVRPKIHTLDDFIDKVAGISWATREDYQVRLPDGTEVAAKQWLREQAAQLPEQPAPEE